MNVTEPKVLIVPDKIGKLDYPSILAELKFKPKIVVQASFNDTGSSDLTTDHLIESGDGTSLELHKNFKPVNSSDVAMHQFTSGTTGKPKTVITYLQKSPGFLNDLQKV